MMVVGVRRSFIIAAFGLSACAQPMQLVYKNLDGSQVKDLVKFEDDKKLCLADMDKADVSGVVISNPNVFIDASNRYERAGKLDRIMEACMLQKGYRLTQIQPQISAAQ